MRCALIQALVLSGAVLAAGAAGYGYTAARWGAPGVASLEAAATICLLAALLAAVPLGLVASYWPRHAGQAAFAGSAVRLLVTGGLALGYQLLAEVHLASFLGWLLVLYLLLLAAETLLAALLVSRRLQPPGVGGG